MVARGVIIVLACELGVAVVLAKSFVVVVELAEEIGVGDGPVAVVVLETELGVPYDWLLGRSLPWGRLGA